MADIGLDHAGIALDLRGTAARHDGAGKSTLLKTVAGLVGPQPGGKILFDGRPIEQVPPHRIVAAGIALVPEGRRLFGEMSVIDNLRIGAYPERARAGESERLERQLTLFPRLAERRQQLAKTMSGGEQQMLAIARGLMSEPRILLLDEPSLGLAPVLVAEIFRLIERLRAQGLAILLSEQNARLSLAIADRGSVIEKGRVTLEGSGKALLADPAVAERYLGVGASVGELGAQRHQRLVGRLKELFQQQGERP